MVFVLWCASLVLLPADAQTRVVRVAGGGIRVEQQDTDATPAAQDVGHNDGNKKWGLGTGSGDRDLVFAFQVGREPWAALRIADT